ncbi:unnamed protein product [Polarella glacialis]|uniref:Uncharacterized protein n=1 Tax=Polarella glacialis TaxID=89957 RepID=A0A813K920_POLGL|nr:unnamed protein product [Polarella glacialis]
MAFRFGTAKASEDDESFAKPALHPSLATSQGRLKWCLYIAGACACVVLIAKLQCPVMAKLTVVVTKRHGRSAMARAVWTLARPAGLPPFNMAVLSGAAGQGVTTEFVSHDVRKWGSFEFKHPEDNCCRGCAHACGANPSYVVRK